MFLTLNDFLHILALSVEKLDEVLEKVDAFLHFDFVDFQEILQRETREKKMNLLLQQQTFVETRRTLF